MLRSNVTRYEWQLLNRKRIDSIFVMILIEDWRLKWVIKAMHFVQWYWWNINKYESNWKGNEQREMSEKCAFTADQCEMWNQIIRRAMYVKQNGNLSLSNMSPDIRYICAQTFFILSKLQCTVFQYVEYVTGAWKQKYQQKRTKYMYKNCSCPSPMSSISVNSYVSDFSFE